MKPLFAGIEGGGTKFVCTVGTVPDETLDKVIEFFKGFDGLFALVCLFQPTRSASGLLELCRCAPPKPDADIE